MAPFLHKLLRIGKWTFLFLVGTIIIVLLTAFLMANFWPAKPYLPPPTFTDVPALRAQVDIDIPIKGAQWQVFGSPELQGVAAFGPTDNTILIAEIEVSDPNWFTPAGTQGFVMRAVPEAARPWLSEPFQIALKKSLKDEALPTGLQCKGYATTFAKSKEPVHGFVCAVPGKILLYLILADSGM